MTNWGISPTFGLVGHDGFSNMTGYDGFFPKLSIAPPYKGLLGKWRHTRHTRHRRNEKCGISPTFGGGEQAGGS